MSLARHGSPIQSSDAQLSQFRKIRTGLPPRLQDDRRIWDYVYNGLLHSVVKNRADTNALARRTLGLPKTDYSTG